MRVWVTRDEDRDGPLCRALHAVGLRAVWMPVLRRQVSSTWDSAVVESLNEEDWLVLTSPFAIEVLARLTEQRKPYVAVVSEVSRQLATANGFRVDMVSSESTSDSLFADIQQRVPSGRICYPRSSLAKPITAWGDVEVISPVLYETVTLHVDRTVVDKVDIIAVTSASAVRAVGRVNLPFASMGPSTSQALRDLGIEPIVEASNRSFSSLSASIACYAKESRQDLA